MMILAPQSSPSAVSSPPRAAVLPALEHVAIRASAGTGKTFQLTNRILAILQAGEAVERILATTFTRKAAGEILERVLLRLAQAALSDSACRELQQQTGVVGLSTTDHLGVLERVVRNLHRVRIGTLDSFFSSVAGVFSLDLGLPPTWSIIEDSLERTLRSEAIRAVLTDNDPNHLATLMRMMTHGTTDRAIARQIHELVEKMYALFMETPESAWKVLDRQPTLSEAELAQQIEQIRQFVGLDKRMAAAVQNDLLAVEQEEWIEFLSKGLGLKIACQEFLYFGKEIPPDLQQLYLNILNHARAVLINRLVDQNEATYELLNRFDHEYLRLKTNRQLFRFNDITHVLAFTALGDRLGEVYYRLDRQVGHLLLDEFQDTAPMQWQVLRPLAEEICATVEGRSFFCVGDCKQAIYGWRGGSAELFDAIAADLPSLTWQSLAKSYRSAPPIIQCVNQVFGQLDQNRVLRDCQSAIQPWLSTFEPHTTARTQLDGYVCLQSAAPPTAVAMPLTQTGNAATSHMPTNASVDAAQTVPRSSRRGDKSGEWALLTAAQLVAELARQHPQATIGVLVRKNRAVARIIHELRRLDCEASEEGGNPLTDSPAVNTFLAALTFSDHPGHTTARFHFAYSPLGTALRFTDHTNEFLAHRVAARIRADLVNRGYGPTLYSWLQKVAADCDRRDVTRLLQLTELAYQYEARATLRPRQFVDFVRSQKVTDPRVARIRVMTIHQAKGLQFDVTVLPELDESLRGQTPAVLTLRTHPAEPVVGVFRYPSEQVRRILPEPVQQAHEQYCQREIQESLCLLYVALTRAIHATYMIVQPSSASEKKLPNTLAGVLRSALTDSSKVDAGQILYEAGNRDWRLTNAAAEKMPIAPATTATAEASVPAATPPAPSLPAAAITPILQLARAPRRRRLRPRTEQDLEGTNAMRLRDRFRRQQYRDPVREELLALCFAQLGWFDDGIPSQDTLRQRLRESKRTDPEIDKALTDFARYLNQPCLQLSLRRPVAPAVPYTWQLWLRQPFACRHEATLLQGIFERVLLCRDAQQQLRRVEIYSFKSDSVPKKDSEWVEYIEEYYRQQMETYHRIARKMFHLSKEQLVIHHFLLEADHRLSFPSLASVQLHPEPSQPHS